MEVTDGRDQPEGTDTVHVPTHTYASFRYVGFHHPGRTTYGHLLDIYRAGFTDWLPTSSYRQADGFHMERVDMRVAREDYCELDLLIPVCMASPAEEKPVS